MKKYIYAMAFSRSEMLNKLQSLTSTLNNHVIKCTIYRESLPEYLPHWIEEIGIYLHSANKLKSKTKLKNKDYMNSLFSSFGTDKDDAEANLMFFKIHNKDYVGGRSACPLKRLSLSERSDYDFR